MALIVNVRPRLVAPQNFQRANQCNVKELLQVSITSKKDCQALRSRYPDFPWLRKQQDLKHCFFDHFLVDPVQRILSKASKFVDDCDINFLGLAQFA